MSQENVDLHARSVGFLSTRAFRECEDLIAPDFRIDNISTAVTDDHYQGVEGLRKWISDTFEAFDEDTRYETEEILADSDNFVVARMRVVGQGARSGAPLVLRWVTVTWFRAGKITRISGYAHRREALKAVGLEG